MKEGKKKRRDYEMIGIKWDLILVLVEEKAESALSYHIISYLNHNHNHNHNRIVSCQKCKQIK